jgi:predicted dehydrogenase
MMKSCAAGSMIRDQLLASLLLQVAERALLAGKHVLLEKPVGPSVAEALQVLAAVRALPKAPVWFLAENYR